MCDYRRCNFRENKRTREYKLNTIASLIMPAVIVLIVANGLLKKEPIFDYFTQGAKDGLLTSVKILPSLVGLLSAITALRSSGLLGFIEDMLLPFLNYVNFPKELVPLAIIRPISGSAALATVMDIIKTSGADSFVGKCASVMMGSTETTFYTLAVYFGYVQITNSRYTVKSALLADLTGIISSVVIVAFFLN